MQKLVEKLGLSEGVASATLWVILSIVLLVVVGLLALWLVRTLRPSLNINGANRGGRPQRLAITDAFPLDRDGRKLVIVRRDNTEHLLLIGGPNDLLVEGNITRHDRSARGLARANEGEGEDAPLQVAPQMPLAPAAPVVAPVVMSPPQPPLMVPPVRREPVAPPPQPVVPPVAPAQVAVQPEPPPAPPVLTLETLLPDARPVPPVVEEAAPAPIPVAPTPVSPPPAPPVAPQPAPAPRPPAMSEMARRLNEALQKPVTGTLRPPFNRSIPPAPPTAGPSASPTPPVTPVAPPPAPPEPPPAPQPEVKPAPAPEPVAKADMDLLEEEMARLLGRPAQPKKPETP